MPTRNGKAAGEFETGLSAFQGRLLRTVSAVKTAAPGKLAALGIADAEQLIAAAAVEEMKGHLAQYLGHSKAEMETLLKEAKKVVPPGLVETLEQPVPRLFSLGALEPTPAMKAQAITYPAITGGRELVSLPSGVNLTNKMPPIRNQAGRGTCVAFTMTAMHEYYNRMQGKARDFSEQHLYYETKQNDGEPDACGTFQASAAQALANRGQCREYIWTYNPNPPCNDHGPLPSRARTNGAKYRLQMQQLGNTDVNAIKASLASLRPVGISIPVYNSWYQSAETERSGRITLRIGNELQEGGHAVCLVGYQEDASAPGGGYFILRNSWSTNWGYQCPYGAGYGTIPYQYIAVDCWEAFTPASPVSQDEDEDQAPEEVKPARTVTITVKGNVNLVIE